MASPAAFGACTSSRQTGRSSMSRSSGSNRIAHAESNRANEPCAVWTESKYSRSRLRQMSEPKRSR
eukprot:7383036-Prymnesium_polylepis.1